MVGQNRRHHDQCPQEPSLLQEYRPSNNKYISDSLLIDMMLKEETFLYVGGAGPVPAAVKERRCV